MKKIIILTHILILSSLFSCKKESAPEEIISNKTDTAAEDVISNKIEKEDGITYLNSNFISLCDRSLFFKNRIIEILGATSCDDVTAESLASVKTLNLRGHYPEGNRLTGLEKNDFQGFVNLQKLDLSHNELFGQDELKDNLFDHLISLEELKLTNNSIFTLKSTLLTKLKNLKTLDLSHNLIEELPPGFLTSNNALEKLNLSSNMILTFDSSVLSVPNQLKTLDLNSNYISFIDRDTFVFANSLVDLNLSNNSIKKVVESSFSKSRKTLKTINLSMNNLRELEFGVFAEMPMLEMLDLSDSDTTHYRSSYLGVSKKTKVVGVKIEYDFVED